jgi:hypothetical protein
MLIVLLGILNNLNRKDKKMLIFKGKEVTRRQFTGRMSHITPNGV